MKTNCPLPKKFSGTRRVSGILSSFLALWLAAASAAMAAPFAYVPNIDLNTVVVFNDTAVLTSVSVGSAPSGVAVNRAGTRAYVANAGAGTVSVIDVVSNTVVETVTVGGVPDGVAVSPDGTTVWVTIGNGSVVQINVSSMPAVVPPPIATGAITLRGIVAVGSRAYAADLEGGNVVMIDPATAPATIRMIPVGTPPDSRPLGIVAHPSLPRVYVADLITTDPNVPLILEVSAIDTDPASTTTFNTVVQRMTVDDLGTAGSPAGIAISPDGGLLYVANDGTNRVAVVSTVSGAVVTEVAVGGAPFGVAVNPLGTRVYVGNVMDGSVSVIDTTASAACGPAPCVIATVLIPTTPFVFGAFATDGPQTPPPTEPPPTPAPPSCDAKIAELQKKVSGLKHHYRGYAKLRAALRLRGVALVEIGKAKAKVGAADARVVRADAELKKGDSALCANHYWRAGHEYWDAYEIAHHVLKYYRHHRR